MLEKGSLLNLEFVMYETLQMEHVAASDEFHYLPFEKKKPLFLDEGHKGAPTAFTSTSTCWFVLLGYHEA